MIILGTLPTDFNTWAIVSLNSLKGLFRGLYRGLWSRDLVAGIPKKAIFRCSSVYPYSCLTLGKV